MLGINEESKGAMPGAVKSGSKPLHIDSDLVDKHVPEKLPKSLISENIWDGGPRIRLNKLDCSRRVISSSGGRLRKNG